jgi:hypothetical protein
VSSRVRPERAGLGTFEQEFGTNYQDRHPAWLIGMRHRVGDPTAEGLC